MSEKLVCPHCGASFRSPATYADHMKQHEQPAGTMFSRKMDKLLSKKKRKGMMVDLSGHKGEVPASESENLKSMLKTLNEIKLAKFSNVIAQVRNVLKARRLKNKNNFWRRQFYNQFGVRVN